MYVDTLPSRIWSKTPYILSVDCTWWLHPKGRKGEKKVTLHGRNRLKNLPKTVSARWSRSLSTVISHVDSMCSWYNVTKKVLYLCGLPPPKSSFPSLIMRKILGKFKPEDILWNAWPGVLKTLKVITNKENLKTCYSQEKARMMW